MNIFDNDEIWRNLIERTLFVAARNHSFTVYYAVREVHGHSRPFRVSITYSHTARNYQIWFYAPDKFLFGYKANVIPKPQSDSDKVEAMLGFRCSTYDFLTSGTVIIKASIYSNNVYDFWVRRFDDVLEEDYEDDLFTYLLTM